MEPSHRIGIRFCLPSAASEEQKYIAVRGTIPRPGLYIGGRREERIRARE